MGTRGLYIFRYKNKWYVFYNHFDSYPEGLGESIVAELKTIDWEEAKRLIEAIGEADVRSRDGSCKCKGLMDALTQPSDYVLEGILEHAPDSRAFDWEYAYTINLDANMFEVRYYSDATESENTQRFQLDAVPANWATYIV